MKLFRAVFFSVMLVLLALSLQLGNIFIGLMFQVAIYGLTVIFLNRWASLVQVLLATGWVVYAGAIDPWFVLPGIIWVLVFAWVLLDGRGSYALRGLLVVPLAAAARLGLTLILHSTGLGVAGALYNPLAEFVALIAGGYTGIFGAAYMGPRVKQWLLKE